VTNGSNVQAEASTVRASIIIRRQHMWSNHRQKRKEHGGKEREAKNSRENLGVSFYSLAIQTRRDLLKTVFEG